MAFTENTPDFDGIVKTIIALDRDGLDVHVLVMNFLIPDKEFNLDKAIRAAATEFCQTEEGKRIYSGNMDYFNWGDFDAYVPESFCIKHGFKRLPAIVADEKVNFDELLVQEEDVFPEDDE